MKHEFRIPTILGLVFLSATALFGGVLTSRYTTNTRSQASESCQPDSIKLGNIVPNAADVSFSTGKDCDITIQVNNNIFLNTATSSKIHYFKVTGLSSGQSYPISIIISGQAQISSTKITTPNSSLAQTDGTSFAWGKVFNQDQSPAPNVIVYLTLPNSQLLSALTTSQGSWNIPSAAVGVQPPSQSNESIQIITASGQNLDLENTINNNQPVPDIILGQSNFALPKYSSVDGINLQQSNLSSGQTGTVTNNLLISYPSQGESIPPSTPEFFGTGPSSSSLDITLSGPISSTSTIIIASNGTWKWSPNQMLTIGSYTLKVGQNNQSLSRNFMISVSNTGLAFVSTPSATTIPTATPTLTIPTSEPSPTPTLVPTETITTPTPRPTKLPTTGSFGPTSFLILSGILLAGASIFLQH